MATERDRPVHYRFGPLQRRGVVAGWRGGQIATIATGLLFAVLVLRAQSSVVGALAALVLVCAAVAVATWPIGGRSLEEWAPDAVRYTTSLGHRRRRSANPFSSMQIMAVDLSSGAADDGWRRRDAAQQAGVVFDDAARTYTAVLRASDAGFVLVGEHEKADRVSAWAGVLASFARASTPVHRLQWVARSVPAGVQGRPRELRHEVLLSVTVHAGKALGQVRSSGGARAGAASAVLREAASLRRRLSDAGISAEGVLAPAELSRAIRLGFGSSNGIENDTRSEDQISPSWQWPWPMGVEVAWREVTVDATSHVTYWISEWPRTDVRPDFLCPLLLLAGSRVAVSVVMEPIAPLEAARKIEQSRTSDIADSELRRRGGFLATARRHREEENLVSRETELADGHAPYRFTGYVTASAECRDELDDACRQAEQAAARCGLELRPCYGDQARAFLATLPLGRGLC